MAELSIKQRIDTILATPVADCFGQTAAAFFRAHDCPTLGDVVRLQGDKNEFVRKRWDVCHSAGGVMPFPNGIAVYLGALQKEELPVNFAHHSIIYRDIPSDEMDAISRLVVAPLSRLLPNDYWTLKRVKDRIFPLSDPTLFGVLTGDDSKFFGGGAPSDFYDRIKDCLQTLGLRPNMPYEELLAYAKNPPESFSRLYPELCMGSAPLLANTEHPVFTSHPAPLTDESRASAVQQLHQAWDGMDIKVLHEPEAYGSESVGGLSFGGDLVGPGIVVSGFSAKQTKDVIAPALKARLPEGFLAAPEYAGSVQLLPASGKGEGRIYVSDAALAAIMTDTQAVGKIRADIDAGLHSSAPTLLNR